MNRSQLVNSVFFSLFLPILTHCGGAPHHEQLANKCHEGLDSAFQELGQAKAEGFGGTVSWAKAATLLSTAKLQEQFDKFPNCINKIQRARFYIRESQKT